jgi:hypothetical protein
MSAKQTDHQSKSMKELKEVSLQTKIVEITFDEFKLEKSIKSGIKFNFDQFQYEFNISIDVNKVKGELSVNLTVNIFSDLEKKNKLGYITSHGIFLVVNFNEVIINDKIPNVILANFIGVLISTTRGFLIVKAQGTPIEGAIIPIVTPNSFFGKK